MRWRSNKVSSIKIWILLSLKLSRVAFVQPSPVKCWKYLVEVRERWKNGSEILHFSKNPISMQNANRHRRYETFFSFHTIQCYSLLFFRFLVDFCITNNVIRNSRYFNRSEMKYSFSSQFWNWNTYTKRKTIKCFSDFVASFRSFGALNIQV